MYPHYPEGVVILSHPPFVFYSIKASMYVEGVWVWTWDDWAGDWASLPLEPCRRPWPRPPGGRRAAGPFAVSARSACPAGSARRAPLGTGCHTPSQLWPGGVGDKAGEKVKVRS